MLATKKQKLMRKIWKVSNSLDDLYQELKDQRFAFDNPLMKDVGKMSLYLKRLFNEFDESCVLRDKAARFKLSEVNDDD